jgi:hypothetical protein
MNTVQVLEAFAILVDRLRAQGRSRLAVRGRHEQAQDLLDLAEELRAILVPVRPNANYRRRLHGQLILKAQSRETSAEPEAPQHRRTGILLGAAALGSLASFAGLIIAYLLHNRNGRATHVARG